MKIKVKVNSNVNFNFFQVFFRQKLDERRSSEVRKTLMHRADSSDGYKPKGRCAIPWWRHTRAAAAAAAAPKNCSRANFDRNKRRAVIKKRKRETVKKNMKERREGGKRVRVRVKERERERERERDVLVRALLHHIRDRARLHFGEFARHPFPFIRVRLSEDQQR